MTPSDAVAAQQLARLMSAPQWVGRAVLVARWQREIIEASFNSHYQGNTSNPRQTTRRAFPRDLSVAPPGALSAFWRGAIRVTNSIKPRALWLSCINDDSVGHMRCPPSTISAAAAVDDTSWAALLARSPRRACRCRHRRRSPEPGFHRRRVVHAEQLYGDGLAFIHHLPASVVLLSHQIHRSRHRPQLAHNFNTPE